MHAPLRLIGILWTAWIVGWMAAAPWSRRTVARQSPAGRFLPAVVFSVGIALYFVHVRGAGNGDVRLLAGSPALPWTGLALVAAGLAFSVWARVHLGRLWSGTVTLKEGHAIVRSGPYAVTRHPIYTGLLLAALGTALAVGRAPAAAGFVLVAVSLVIKSGQEERMLAGHFGEAYEEYRSRTPRLIPYLW